MFALVEQENKKLNVVPDDLKKWAGKGRTLMDDLENYALHNCDNSSVCRILCSCVWHDGKRVL